MENTMYEKAIHAIKERADFEIRQCLYRYNENNKNIVDEIIEFNEMCDKDISHNNETFWNDIIDKSYYSEDILSVVADSPYVPFKIIEEILPKISNPYILIKLLDKDYELSDKWLDYIQKKAKKVICDEILKPFYNGHTDRLNMAQYAINYYANKSFNNNRVKTDPFLMTLCYSNDKEFLQNCLKSPLLNELRLTYLIDNTNIDETTRNQMFEGIGVPNGVTPHLNSIKNPTSFMIESIYLLNSDGYAYSTNNKNRTATLNKLIDMFNKGLLNEALQKDAILRYEKGDNNYRYFVRRILSATPYPSVIKAAEHLDFRIFNECFINPNLTQEQIDELAKQQLPKIINSVKRKYSISQGNYRTEDIIEKTKLTEEQYELFLSLKDRYIYTALAVSPHTPSSILEKISKLKLPENEKSIYACQYPLVSALNLEMRKNGFSDKEITCWCNKFARQLAGYYNIPHCSTYTTPQAEYIDIYTSGRQKIFDNIINTLAKNYTNETEATLIERYRFFRNDFIDKYNRDNVFDVKNNSYAFLYNQKYEIIHNINEAKTLGDIYIKFHKYADKLVDIIDEMEKRDQLKTKETTRF